MSKSHQFISVNVTLSTSVQMVSDWGFTATQLAGAVGLQISTDQPINYLANGAIPTETFGIPITASDSPVELNEDPRGVRFVRGSGTDCNVTAILETYEVV